MDICFVFDSFIMHTAVLIMLNLTKCYFTLSFTKKKVLNEYFIKTWIKMCLCEIIMKITSLNIYSLYTSKHITMLPVEPCKIFAL